MSYPLEVEIKEKLPKGVTIIQIDDGSVFYWKSSPPQRLYTKNGSKEIDAELPSRIINYGATFGNAIYFSNEVMVFKASITPTGSQVKAITERPIQDAMENILSRNYQKENRNEAGGILTAMRKDGKKYAYGIWENSEQVIIKDDEFTSKLTPDCLIGKTLIYRVKTSTCSEPKLHTLDNNAMLVETPAAISSDFRKSSPFYYFTCDRTLYAVDTESRTLLRPLGIKNVNSVETLVSVMNGVVTLIVKMEDGRYLATAELPKLKAAQTANITRDAKVHAAQTIENCKGEVAPSVPDLDDLAEQCGCAICNEVFDSANHIPRVLDCGHTFCEICLYDERLCVINVIKCPNCSKQINVQGKVLPVNYTIIGMAEQLMKTRADPKVMCKQCKTNHPTTAVRLCTKKDCDMYNQLLCLNCVIDGGHGGYSIKYDVRLEKIRKELRAEVNNLCLQVEQKRKTVVDKSEKLLRDLKTKLSKAAIPPNVIGQIDTIKSLQEAKEYQEIVKDLTSVLMKECDALEEEFDRKVNIKSLS